MGFGVDPVGALVAWDALEFHGGQEAAGIRSAFPDLDLSAGSGEHDSGAQPGDTRADNQDWLRKIRVHLPGVSGRNGPRKAGGSGMAESFVCGGMWRIPKGVQ